MKKLIAIAASAVLAMGAFAFTACSPATPEDPTGAIPPAGFDNYEEVDVSSEEKKQEFVEELSTRINPELLFGDMTKSDWSFGLAEDAAVKAEVSIDMDELKISGNVELKEALKAKLSVPASETEESFIPFGIKMSAEIGANGNVNLPELIYSQMGEQGPLVKSLLTNFDYSAKAYLDNEYVYASLSSSILSKLPEEAGLPESGKFKAPLSLIMGGGDYNEPDYDNDPGITYALTNEVTPDDETAAMIEQVITILKQYSVSVAVSTDAGYSVKLTAGTDTVLAILGDVADEEVVTTLKQVVTFKTCALTAYLAVDENGVFQQVSLGLNIDLSVKASAGTLGNGSPNIEGSAKLEASLNITKFDGEIKFPTDIDSYVDLFAEEE